MGRGKKILKVRERHYDYSFRDKADFLFDSGNYILTFEYYAWQLIIPAGERFFIRSVQKLAPLAKDPVLKNQIKGFMGQEASHARETDRFLEPLSKLGYPVEAFENWFEKLIRKIEVFFNWPLANLAVTAAIEHYTAVWGIWGLRSNYLEKFPSPYREFFQWHSAEELEHKAVAFDLFQELAPRGYFRRVFGFFLGMGVVSYGYHRAFRMLCKHSGLSRAQLRKERKNARKIRIPLMSWRFPLLWKYLRPGFHPNDIDDGGLGKKTLARQEARAAT